MDGQPCSVSKPITTLHLSSGESVPLATEGALRQGLLCLPGACSTFKVLLEPLDSLEEHKGNEVLKRRVRSGDMLGVRNPELSLWVVEITQSLKPLKAEARFYGGIHGKVIGPHPVLSRIMYLDSSVS